MWPWLRVFCRDSWEIRRDLRATQRRLINNHIVECLSHSRQMKQHISRNDNKEGPTNCQQHPRHHSHENKWLLTSKYVLRFTQRRSFAQCSLIGNVNAMRYYALWNIPDWRDLYQNISMSVQRNQNIRGILSTVNDNDERIACYNRR